MSGHRVARMSEEIKRELARLFRDAMKDPRLGFVSVTAVEVSKDSRHAKVFVSVLGSEEERKNSLVALKQASGFLRSELAQAIIARYIPELVFTFDPSIEQGARIAKLLHSVEGENNGNQANDPHS